MKFEVDKWYRGPDNFYIKFLRLHNHGHYHIIDYSERIYLNKHEVIEDYWANTEYENYALNNPATLEELQQYLPIDHPDRITESKVDDLSHLAKLIKNLNIK